MNELAVRRFWSYVDQTGGPQACWLWTKSVFQTTGYGQSTDILRDGKVSTTAHRQAWMLTNGDPGEKVVRHRCPGGPNRLCCNPAHMLLGTHKDNALDRTADGTELRGEAVPNSVLTEATVLQVMTYRRQGFGSKQIGDMLGHKPTTISSVINGYSWNHVTGLPKTVALGRQV